MRCKLKVRSAGEYVFYIYEYCPSCKTSHWLTSDEALVMCEWRDKGMPNDLFKPDSTNPHHQIKDEGVKK